MAPDGSVINRFNVATSGLDQLAAEVAFNGERFLVAWSDRRRLPQQTYYAPVTAQGQVVDTVGTWIPGQDTGFSQNLPAVAACGTDFLVSWLGGDARHYSILATRFSGEGIPRDSLPLAVFQDTAILERVAVASDSQCYIIAWSGQARTGTGYELCFRRLTPNGEFLDSLPTVIAASPDQIIDPALAFLDDRWLAVWTQYVQDPDIFGSRILVDGSVLDPGGFPVSNAYAMQGQPDVAAGTDRFLVVWTDAGSGEFDIMGELVDTSGHVGLCANPVSCPAPKLGLQVRSALLRRSVCVSFTLDRGSSIRLAVYDAQGRLMKTLASGIMSAGTHVTSWNGEDALGFRVPAGTYFCRLTAAEETAVVRLSMTH